MHTRYRQNRHELQIDRGPLQIRQTYLTPPSQYFDDLRIRQVEIVAAQNDVRLALSTLLPAGWQMHETDAVALHGIEAKCDTDDRYILTPQYLRLRSAAQSRVKPFLTQPHAMAALLHEIGHALYEPIVSDEEANVAAKMRIFGDMLGDFASRLDAQGPEAYRKHVLQPEIDAHRFALRTILHWRTQGLDLEPQLSHEQLLQKMAQQLSTYAESGGVDGARKLLEKTGH